MMKRIVMISLTVFLMAVCLLLMPNKVQAATVASGSCGENLTWTLDDAGTLTISGTGAMTDWVSESVPWYSYRSSINSVVIEKGVTTIGYGAFARCTALTSVTIPDSVVRIINEAFTGCTSLTGVYITDLLAWCRIGFAVYPSGSCTSNPLVCANKLYLNGQPVTNLVIPDGVTSIGNGTFYGCTTLSSITIPDSVTSIGEAAFSACTGLTSVTIPDGVTRIGNNAFYGCTSLTSVTIPDSMTVIGYCAFTKCDSLTGVYISNLKAWCEMNFAYTGSPLAYANRLYLNGQLVTDLVIPDGVTNIGGYAFQDYTGLTSVTIPDSVTSIGIEAFSNCTNLTSVTFSNGVISVNETAFNNTAWYNNQPDGLVYAGKVAYKYKGTCPATVVIKDGTTEIAGDVFSNCAGLTSITIPDSVTSIGESAFSNCAGLTSITISDSVTSIGKSAFSNCTGLTSITIPDSVTSIDYRTFYNCTGLTSITIPDSVTSISDDAFHNTAWYNNQPDGLVYAGKVAYKYKGTCPATVVIKDGTLGIADFSFYNCTGLTSITIPDSVTSIGAYAFHNTAWYNNQPDGLVYAGKVAYTYKGTCPATVAIKDGTLGIADSAFDWCNFTSVTIPDSVISIGDSAFNFFEFSSAIKTLCYAGTAEQWKAIIIGSDNGRLIDATKHYEVYWTKNCENSGWFCPSCNKFVIKEYAEDGTHTFDSSADMECDDCGYIRNVYSVELSEEPVTTCTVFSKSPDTTGGVLKVTLSDGTEQTVAMTPEMITGFDCTKLGKQTVTVHYGGRSTTYQITVVLGTPDKLTLKAMPSKLEYRCGDALDYSGLVVTAHYGSNTIDLTKNDLTADAVDMDKAGVQTVNLRLGSASVSFKITVYAPILTVTVLPDKLQYLTGDTPDFTGLQLQLSYGPVETVKLALDDVTVKQPDMNTAGRKPVTVTYNGSQTTFEIYVHTIGDLLLDSSLYPESSHNYASNSNETKTFTYSGAKSLTLTFSASSFTENNYDFVYVLDGSGNIIGKYCGSMLANLVVTVPGDTVQLRLTSDSSVNKYGYSFASITAETMVHSYELGECTVCGKPQSPYGGFVYGTFTGYDDLAAAIAAGDWVKLFEDADVNLSLTGDLYIDLNGYDLTGTVTTNGYKVYGMDSKTDNYTCEAIGYMNLVDENGEAVVPVTHFKNDITGSTKRYMAVKDDNGYSFHRFYLGITHQTLKPTTTGVGYKAVFYGDSMVAENLDSFGFTMQLGNYTPKTFTKTADSFVSGKVITLRIDDYDVENYGQTDLYATVMLKLTDGTVIESTQCAMTMRSLLETLNTNYTDFGADQLTAIAEMIEKHAIIQSWKVENLI